MQIKPISRKQNIVVQEFEKELLVYDLKTNKAYCLNETSAMVYQLCDGTKTVAEINQSLNKNLKLSISEDFILLALNELNRDGLFENADELEDYFAGMSRRKMIKKVGLASMIALPLISSVVAPNAANAQSSCLAPGTLSTSLCSVDSDRCNSSNLNLDVSRCCSGMGVSVNQPCPIRPIPVACACA